MNEVQEIQECQVLKDKLANKIWITRKNHICASERLLKSAAYVEFVNVYYSVVLILFSLLSVSPFAEGKGILISYISLSGSIALTVSIIFANSLNYRQRALALKQSYISLQLLLAELEESSNLNNVKLLEIEDKYAKLLSAVENHQYIDFVNVVRTNNINGHCMSLKEWMYFLGYYMWHGVWKVLFVILPIVGLFFVMR